MERGLLPFVISLFLAYPPLFWISRKKPTRKLHHSRHVVKLGGGTETDMRRSRDYYYVKLRAVALFTEFNCNALRL